MTKKTHRHRITAEYRQGKLLQALAGLEYHSIKVWEARDYCNQYDAVLANEMEQEKHLAQYIIADQSLTESTKLAAKNAVKTEAKKLHIIDFDVEEDAFEHLLVYLNQIDSIPTGSFLLSRWARFKLIDELKKRKQRDVSVERTLEWQLLEQSIQAEIAGLNILDRQLTCIEEFFNDVNRCHARLLSSCDLSLAKIARILPPYTLKDGREKYRHRSTIKRWLDADRPIVEAFFPALLSLREPRKAVMEMFVYDGLQWQQIAVQLGFTIRTVRKLFVQAKIDIAANINGKKPK